MDSYRNPKPTVDAVIIMDVPVDEDPRQDKIVLVKRKNPPYGWALPGGFVNEGESFERAAIREVLEETGLDIDLDEQFYTYSDPTRDPRQHVATTVFLATITDWSRSEPKAADDAAEVRVVSFQEALEEMNLAFDHKQILEDVATYRETGDRPVPKMI